MSDPTAWGDALSHVIWSYYMAQTLARFAEAIEVFAGLAVIAFVLRMSIRKLPR